MLLLLLLLLLMEKWLLLLLLFMRKWLQLLLLPMEERTRPILIRYRLLLLAVAAAAVDDVAAVLVHAVALLAVQRWGMEKKKHIQDVEAFFFKILLT